MGADTTELAEMLSAMVKGGMPPKLAMSRLASVEPDRIKLGALEKEFERRTKRVRTLRDPRSLEKEGIETWYEGPEESDAFWPAFRGQLEESRWAAQDVEALNDASSKVVSLLPHP